MVGAGGLGSATLNYLAAAGVGRLRIVENDTVSLSNLQRQILYTTADLDAPKAEVAAARLSRLNPACRIEIRTDRLDGDNADEILSDCDVVVDCTDNYATRYAIDDFCSARRIPMVYGTAEQIGGQVSVFNTAGAGSYRSLYPEQPVQQPIVGVLSPIVGVIGSLQALETIKVARGYRRRTGRTAADDRRTHDAHLHIRNLTLYVRYSQATRHGPRTTPHRRPDVADPERKRVLEIGARDCYLSRKLTALYPEVVALDLTKPEIDAPGITAVQGDVTGLRFANNAFDTVFCTEVLEHVPPEKLQQACNEIVRVASRYAVIGVPYRQDLRANRTRCLRCGAVNPTTGHLNRFDRQRLTALFPGMTPREIRLTGRGQAVTNPLSVAIYRLCGYPYGSYEQEEGCIRCGEKLVRPKIDRIQWALCFVARALNQIQYKLYGRNRPIWIHILFEKTV